LRWDTPAGALDVEMLKSKVTKEDNKTKRTLDRIQEKLQRAMESITTMQVNGDASGYSQHGHSANDSATDSMPVDEEANYLRQVPTELLFHALRRRHADFT